MIYPLFILVPFSFCSRNCIYTQSDFRDTLMEDYTSEKTLIQRFHVFRVFGQLNIIVTVFFFVELLMSIFVAILPEGQWQMA